MIIEGKQYRTVWMEGETIFTINQLLLPDKFEILQLTDYHQVARAIRTMVVRGAPAIGGMGAYGLAQAIAGMDSVDWNRIDEIRDILLATRPTAHDLRHGLDFIVEQIQQVSDLQEMKKMAMEAAEEYADVSATACQRIGELGDDLIKSGNRLLTHCNAGALATIDYGTALAPMRMAHYSGKEIFVYVDETRPRLQGAALTAWELGQEGIDHVVIADNAAGYFMWNGEIDMVITGADRIAANGDAANKIGTYEKAVVARENSIPFYIAAPKSTIDFNCPSGRDIPIEERVESEVLQVKGVSVAADGSPARNPAFDVTPAEYITAIITEKGIFKPEEIHQLQK